MLRDTQRRKLLVIDDSPIIHKIVREVLKDVCDVESAHSANEAFELLGKAKPDLILLDVEMPEKTGFEAIQELKRNPDYEDIPVIFLTAQNDMSFEIKAFELGAVDFITKPFMPPLLIKRVQLHLELAAHRDFLRNSSKELQRMVEEKTEIIKELQNAIIFTMSEIVEMRDGTTGGHILRTQGYYGCILDYMVKHNIYADQLAGIEPDMLREASQLHDIGKVAISDSILLKPGKLTPEEFEIMKTHTTLGEKSIRKAMELTQNKEFLNYAAIVAVSHHEKWDGSGYPHNLQKEEIHIAGRIMAVVDVYDALVSERPYKKKMSHEQAMQILNEGRGIHFDPVLIDIANQLSDVFKSISEQE